MFKTYTRFSYASSWRETRRPVATVVSTSASTPRPPATCAPLPILKRLFPAAAAPLPELDEAEGTKRYRMRDGADAGVFSKELFWHILSYWHTFTDDAVVLRDAVHRDHEDYVQRSEANREDY